MIIDHILSDSCGGSFWYLILLLFQIKSQSGVAYKDPLTLCFGLPKMKKYFATFVDLVFIWYSEER